MLWPILNRLLRFSGRFGRMIRAIPGNGIAVYAGFPVNTAVGPAKVKKLSYEDLFVHLQNICHLSFSCLDSGENEKI